MREVVVDAEAEADQVTEEDADHPPTPEVEADLVVTIETQEETEDDLTLETTEEDPTPGTTREEEVPQVAPLPRELQ